MTRESMNLSLEDLALRIKEKASLLRKIEREELVPEDDVRKKLEKELKIKLTEETTEEKLKSRGGSKVLTLGDIANIRKR
jgi:transcriptional regulator, XRE family